MTQIPSLIDRKFPTSDITLHEDCICYVYNVQWDAKRVSHRRMTKFG